MLRHILIEVVKTKDKEHSLKAAREKWYITPRRTITWITGFLIRNYGGNNKVEQNVFSAEKKNFHPEF